jgi:hypothetical protein
LVAFHRTEANEDSQVSATSEARMREVNGQFVIKKYGTGEGGVSAVESNKSTMGGDGSCHATTAFCVQSGQISHRHTIF